MLLLQPYKVGATYFFFPLNLLQKYKGKNKHNKAIIILKYTRREENF